VVLGSIVLCVCTGRCVLLGEVAVKSGMSELEQALEDLGAGVEVSGGLLDYFPAGPVLHIDGMKTLICWERLVLAQLVED
jgi:hypothetical protein